MATNQDIAWFKSTYGEAMKKGVKGTPFTVDMLTAIACQETGSIWGVLRKKDLTPEQIAELCVGDTLDDTGGRKAFPKNKAALLAHPRGDEMFKVGNEALKTMAKVVTEYKGAAGNPNKFCHGYGVFQFDIQFFKDDPDYFLERKWATFEGSLSRAVGELKSAAKKVGLGSKTSLTDMEMAKIAIAYNTGGFNPAKGLKQGHKPKGGKHYGENFFDFLTRAHTIAGDSGAGSGGGGGAAERPLAKDKDAIVTTGGDPLLLRGAPRKDPGNVKARLPNGHRVKILKLAGADGFAEVRTKVDGDTKKGFAAAQFLKRAPD
ncbi:MAG TPA: SH3 domain-containing protein [Allosphingosinicella sp.]